MKCLLYIGIVLSFLLSTFALNGCGQDGPLYLPKDKVPVNQSQPAKKDNKVNNNAANS